MVDLAWFRIRQLAEKVSALNEEKKSFEATAMERVKGADTFRQVRDVVFQLERLENRVSGACKELGELMPTEDTWNGDDIYIGTIENGYDTHGKKVYECWVFIAGDLKAITNRRTKS